ncbi:hypothetical protein EGW08_004424 [Elysia chlorotica]|uniref:C2H2-type domain-containing protein n=1 Tax=Elysia chlorotica TaxID=188477 RepID=A0A433U201_ELYCH|nr:hypothetical protein EGW08_004424 [Elysia chlorotica]
MSALTLQCPFCKSQFKSTLDLCTHKNTMHKHLKLNCFLCDFKSKRMDKWVKHLSKKHFIETPKLTHLIRKEKRRLLAEPVTLNGKRAKLSENTARAEKPVTRLKRHSDQDLSNKEILDAKALVPNLICAHCDKVFVSEAAYQSHQSKVTKSTSSSMQDNSSEVLGYSIGPATWKCLKCSQTFASAAKLSRHTRLHCHICPYTAGSKTEIDRHLRGHNEEKIFHCPLCDYKAAVKSAVTLHLRTHTEERPFPCDQCDYAARTSSQLISHKLRHSGKKPYQCNTCGQRFTQAGSLGKHKKKEICVKVDLSSVGL